MDKRGKMIVSVLILFIILVSFSLYFVLATTSNTKVYNSTTNTATIKNGGNDIATIKLNTPQVYNVMRGKDRLVAEFTIDNYADASNVFNNMEFYDIKNNNEKINREFTYKYKTISYVIIPKYDKICYIAINSSEICPSIKNGTRLEEKISWNVFNDQAMLPGGDITVGIFTNVYPNENIEWIPTLYGVKINEWAEWSESLENGLISWWEASSTYNNYLDLKGAYNGTLQGGAQVRTGNNNDNKEVIYLDGTDDNVIAGTNLPSGTSPFTILLRINATAAGYKNFWSRGTNGDSVIIVTTGDGAVSVYHDGSSFMGNIPACNAGTAGQRWIEVVYTRNSSGEHIFCNGRYIDTDPQWTVPTGDLYFGRAVQTGSGGNGTGEIYKYAIWNRELNASDILLLNDTYFFQTPPDVIPPQTTTLIITPSTPKSNQSLQCNATLTDDQQTNLTAYWKWYKNNITNLTGSKANIQNGTPILITTLSVGNTTKGEQWICEVKPFDGINYGNASNSTAVTILNSAPTQTNPLLSTLSGKNFSYENLTCYNQSTSDADKDTITNVYNWYKNSQPLNVLYLPFEINANDYSGNNNSGIIYGAVFTTGKVGKALSFDGIDDYVNLSRPSSLINLDTTFSVETWIYSNNNTGQHLIFDNCEAFATKGYCLLILDNEFRFHVDGGGAAKATAGGIQTGQWYHVVGTYNNESIKIYVNGGLVNTTALAGPVNKATGAEDIIIGFNSPVGINKFEGKIDEVRVYPYALGPKQIQANYNLEYNKIVSQETSGGDNYMCQITPNDAEVDGTTLNSSVANIKWGITFNVTSGEDGSQINNFNINCNNSFSASAINSPYTSGFLPGSYSCTFTRLDSFDETINFNADNDKTINVILSRSGFLSTEEHTWLEAIYNCVVLGDCSLYNMLLEMNQTIGKVWEQTKPTDNSVITFENITNKIVDSTHNLTIDYMVNIPIKAGYSLGTYLPVRIGYWFLNTANTTCYNQGTKPTGVEEPYCQPLIIETVGPMGGQVNFTIKLHPSLPVGNYSIKRIVDIDPNNVWINYGQEMLDSFVMAESLSTYGIGVEKTGEVMSEKEGILQNIKSGITGAVTGVSQLFLSGWQIVIIITMLCITFIVFIIVRYNTIKLKR